MGTIPGPHYRYRVNIIKWPLSVSTIVSNVLQYKQANDWMWKWYIFLKLKKVDSIWVYKGRRASHSGKVLIRTPGCLVVVHPRCHHHMLMSWGLKVQTPRHRAVKSKKISSQGSSLLQVSM